MSYPQFNKQRYNQPPNNIYLITTAFISVSDISVVTTTAKATMLSSTSDIRIDITRARGAAANILSNSGIDSKIAYIANAISNISSKSNLQGTINIQIPFSTHIESSSNIYINTIRSINALSTFVGKSYVLAYIQPVLSGVINDSSRQFTSWIELYFDEVPMIVDTSVIESFSLLEELKADTNNPIGDITANEFTLSLDNSARRFSPTNVNSDLYGKLVPGIKIKPYLGIHLDETTTITVELGTFYSGDWQAPSNSILCTVTCYDRLYNMINLPFGGMRIFIDTTFKELYAKLFRLAGLSDHEFRISDSLDTIIKVAYIPAGTIGSALKYLSEASGSYVYVARDDVVEVKVVDYNTQVAAHLTDSNQIKQLSIPTQYLETYAVVNIPYYSYALKEDIRILSISNFILKPGDNEIDGMHFSSSPVSRVTKIEIKGAPSIKVNYYEATTDQITMNINNPGATDTEVSIEIYGDVYEFTSVNNSIKNDALVPYVKDKELRVGNNLVQSQAHSDWYISRLKAITDNPSAPVDIAIRGNPYITPATIISIEDINKQVPKQYVLVTRSSLDYRGSISMSLGGYIVPREVL